MKTDDLKKIIRGIIQEEIREQLPSLIPQVLAEILNSKSVPTKGVNRSIPNRTQQVTQPSPKKEVKKYSNNPLLNQVLNETVNKITPENSYTGYTERPTMSPVSVNINDPEQVDDSVDYGMLNESTSREPIVANVTPVNEDQAKILSKINRDFRGLMKAVDEKKKQGVGGFGGGVSLS